MRYVVLRSLEAIALLAGSTLVVFLLLHAVPGDPAELMLGEFATPESLARVRASLGLDEPLYRQYLTYAGNMLRGDFGTSFRAHQPVLPYILERFPATLQLTAVAVALALLTALPLGILAATKRYTRIDRLTMGLALLGQATPSFWLGLMLISIFAVELQVLPASGFGAAGLDRLEHLVLPSVTLAAFLVGLLIRLTRAGMLDVLTQDYVRTARAKGLTEPTVLSRHALRNALIPIVTVLGLQVGTLLGGAVITEAVFAWPGIGSLMIDAIAQRDYPVVQAIVLLMAAAFILINWAVDISYFYLDPRMRRH